MRVTAEMKKSEGDLERERPAEQREGISRDRRGSPAAASDKPEENVPHPQDVNEISQA